MCAAGRGNSTALAINFLVGNLYSLLFFRRMTSEMGSTPSPAPENGHRSLGHLLLWTMGAALHLDNTLSGISWLAESVKAEQMGHRWEMGGEKWKRVFRNMDVYYLRPTQANYLLGEG